jgi:hypothetical protein
VSSSLAADPADNGTIVITYAWRASDADPTYYTERSSYFVNFYLCGTASPEASCATAQGSGSRPPEVKPEVVANPRESKRF